jgi:hypothetical protein
MASWKEFSQDAPELADALRARFDTTRHKLLATLRKDGSPRISGIETTFADGELWLGMMPGSLKARDLKRDGRLALHSSSPDPPEERPEEWVGDAKLGGRAAEVVDEASKKVIAPGSSADFHLFRVNITDVAVVRVGNPPDHLIIDSWREGRGTRRSERR